VRRDILQLGRKDVIPLSNQPMEEILQCSVCLTVPPPPWWACKNGHGICLSCFNKLENLAASDSDSDSESEGHRRCPVCRCVFVDDEPVAQGLAAQLVEKYHPEFCVSCPNEGCAQPVPLGTLAAHKSACAFRRVLCPVDYLRGCDCDGTCMATEKIEHIRANTDYIRLFERSPLQFVHAAGGDHLPLFLMDEGICVYIDPLKSCLVFYSITEEDRLISVSLEVANVIKTTSVFTARSLEKTNPFPNAVLAVPELAKKEGYFSIDLDVSIVSPDKKRAAPEGGLPPLPEQGRTKRGRIIKAPVRPGE
jgi:hypothetical protein